MKFKCLLFSERMPSSIKNSATNKNDINIKVIVGDVPKKRKPRRRAPSGDSGPPAPPPSVINNILPGPQPTQTSNSYPPDNHPSAPSAPEAPRPSGATMTMSNRPYRSHVGVPTFHSGRFAEIATHPRLVFPPSFKNPVRPSKAMILNVQKNAYWSVPTFENHRFCKLPNPFPYGADIKPTKPSKAQ